jgi:hypothetical protein
MKAVRHIVLRGWLLGLAAVASVLIALISPGPQGGSLSAAVEKLAAGEGCPAIQEQSFGWIRPDRAAASDPMEWHPAVFLGREASDAPRDVFVADFRVASDGRPREMRRLTNLSRTADGDEAALATAGDGRVAFAARLEEGFGSVDLVDFAGEPEELTADWTEMWQMANRITNFQRTGRASGIHWRSYVFLDPPDEIELGFDRGPAADLVAALPSGELRIDRSGATSSPAVIAQEMVKGRPALLAWAVDTVRAVPWVGRRKIEWLEKYWFDFSDWLARLKYDLVGETEAESLPADFPVAGNFETGVPGWPPATPQQLLKRRQEGEGVWLPVDDGLFTPDVPGPPLFFQTFVRVDRKRPFARVHVTAWDPSRVSLQIMAGVVEPLSTTGIRGRGEVPRDSTDGKDVSRLVGGFNGAFQALHGEWGMVLDRRPFLPPRAYGSTVAVYDDERVAMGTWPHPVGELPDGMRDLRQNVNPLVEGGKLNPYKRVWWGGVPQGVEERVFTVRSGVCMTFGGKLAYFWGDHQSPETLGNAMIATGCDYGIHLDMNAGHCGFEYYRIDNNGDQPELKRELRRRLEAEGIVPRRDDLFYRARKMANEMSQMRFPRYIGRDPRDFFYLVLRESILDHPPAEAVGGEWRPLAGVEGYPVAVASAELPEDLQLLKADQAQLAFAIEDARPEDALLAVPFTTGGQGISTGLVRDQQAVVALETGAFGLSFGERGAVLLDPGQPGEEPNVVQGVSAAVARMFSVRHAVGVDRAGYLLFASGQGGIEQLEQGLAAAGAERVMALLPPSQGNGEPSYWLVARQRGIRTAFRIFEDTEPVGPAVWGEVFRKRGKLLKRRNKH